MSSFSKAKHASVGALGAAAQTLVALGKSSVGIPLVDQHAVIHAQHIPKRWDAEMIAVASNDLTELQKAPRSDVPPFGSVQTRVIWFAPAAAKPK